MELNLSWYQRFFDPIILPGPKPLITLRDATHYITMLLEAEQQAPKWQAAIEVLPLIGENGGDPMMARIAMMQALHRHKPSPDSVSRRKRAKGERIVR
jgi:hypothetical protein